MNEHKFKYKWKLIDGYPAQGIEKHGLKVFGTFICGGGSTMGYKLAGFEHLGGVEIDPPIADVYKANHNPKYLFIEDIRDFANRLEFPEELYNLDILDGSPPCSSFSMAGNREKDWGKEKVFREGQSLQRLDDLFFDYIKLAKKLQPKLVIAENVKGMLQGNAKVYVKRIKYEFEQAGYKVPDYLTTPERDDLVRKLYELQTGKNYDTGLPNQPPEGMKRGGPVTLEDLAMNYYVPDYNEDDYYEMPMALMPPQQRMSKGGLTQYKECNCHG